MENLVEGMGKGKGEGTEIGAAERRRAIARAGEGIMIRQARGRREREVVGEDYRRAE